MRSSQQQHAAGNRTSNDPESFVGTQSLDTTVTLPGTDPTIGCYNRRSRTLTDAYRAEWWLAIAVLLLIVGMGVVAI
jgi:hypothetical protein